MARAGQNLRARNARPGDTVDLAPGSSLDWLSDAVGYMSYEDLGEKWGLIDKNPTGETKNIICLADLSNTAIVQGRKFDPDQEQEVDASAIPEEQIDCTWIPIPDNLVVTMNTPSATKQLGTNRDAGFIGLFSRGVKSFFGRGKREEPAAQEEPIKFAPEQVTGGEPVTGLPVKYEEPLVYPGERTTYHEQRDEEDEAIPLRSMSLAVPDDSDAEALRQSSAEGRKLLGELRRSQWTPVGVSIMEFHALIDKILDELESGITDSASIRRMKEFMAQQPYESSSSDPIEAGPGWVPPQLPVVQERGFEHWSSEEEDDDPSSPEDPEQELIEEGEPGPKRKRGVKFTFGSGPTYYLTKEGMEELLVGPYSRGEFNKATYDKGIRLASKPIKRRDALNSGIASDVFEAQVEEGYWSTNPEDFFISERNTMLAIREPDDPDKESFWDSTKKKAGAGVKLGGEVALGSGVAFAAGAGAAVGLASKLRSPLARLGGAALTGLQAGAGAALKDTAVGKFLNIETKRLTMLSRVPVGETIMFTVGDERLGIRRGDRGLVRMGSRGKNKVVYFPDTGEIVQPDQWTMVAITGAAPTAQTGTIGMGLGRFEQTGFHGVGAGGGGGFRPSGVGGAGEFQFGELAEDFVAFFPKSMNDHSPASEQQRELLAKRFNVDIGGPYSAKRKELYRRLRGQRGQPIIRGPQDLPEVPPQKGSGPKARFSIKKNEDTGRLYILTVVPASRIPSESQSPSGWLIWKSKGKVFWPQDFVDYGKVYNQLVKQQPDSDPDEDVMPYIVHDGMEGYGQVASPDEADADADVARAAMVAKVQKEGEAAGLDREAIRKKQEEALQEKFGSDIIEFEYT